MFYLFAKQSFSLLCLFFYSLSYVLLMSLGVQAVFVFFFFFSSKTVHAAKTITTKTGKRFANSTHYYVHKVTLIDLKAAL